MSENVSRETDDFTPIESSMFDGHHYNPDTRKLRLQFKNGSVYEHDDVPIEKHTAFTESASPGKFYNEKIKPNHPGRKV